MLSDHEVRADMPRSRYLTLLAKTDLNRGGALMIDPGPNAGAMNLVKEITEFLKIAVPALAHYQRQKTDPDTSPPPADPPEAAAENQFWRDFLDERDEILTLKWIESQKAGKDIGFERAIQLWLEHRPDWLAAHSQAEE